MEKTVQKDVMAEKYSHIVGWGVDANPKNEPTYPIKNYTGDDHKQLKYKRPTLQDQGDIEILRSNERPGLSAVFGTSVPPSGISGMIRRIAFRHSESSYWHWLPLFLADRVNVIEGLVGDLAHGRIPNVFAEMGARAEWKHNPKRFVRKVVVGALITTAVIMLATRKRKSLQKS